MGVTASAVILVMCLTGVVLAFQRQILLAIDDWHTRPVIAPSSSPALSPNEAVERAVCNVKPFAVSNVTEWNDTSRPIQLELRNQKIVYANPYTGEILGVGSQGARQFFRTVTEVHRWLGMQGDYRKLGKSITGAGTLLLLALACSGIFLWWPRNWSWRAVRGSLLFRAGLRGKARDWNWHNVVAIWSAIPLVIIALSGVVMSYPWANDAVYRMTGSAPPPQRESASSSRGGSGHEGAGSNPKHAALTSTQGVDVAALLASGKRQVPAWRSITLRLGEATGPVTAIVLTGPEGRPDVRQQLTLDRSSGAVMRSEGFTTFNAGRRLRGWIRFAHTGEAAGIPGEAIAALASLGGTVLVYTGIALTLRRLATTVRKRTSELDSTQSASGLPTFDQEPSRS